MMFINSLDIAEKLPKQTLKDDCDPATVSA